MKSPNFFIKVGSNSNFVILDGNFGQHYFGEIHEIRGPCVDSGDTPLVSMCGHNPCLVYFYHFLKHTPLGPCMDSGGTPLRPYLDDISSFPPFWFPDDKSRTPSPIALKFLLDIKSTAPYCFSALSEIQEGCQMPFSWKIDFLLCIGAVSRR